MVSVVKKPLYGSMFSMFLFVALCTIAIVYYVVSDLNMAKSSPPNTSFNKKGPSPNIPRPETSKKFETSGNKGTQGGSSETESTEKFKDYLKYCDKLDEFGFEPDVSVVEKFENDQPEALLEESTPILFSVEHRKEAEHHNGLINVTNMYSNSDLQGIIYYSAKQQPEKTFLENLAKHCFDAEPKIIHTYSINEIDFQATVFSDVNVVEANISGAVEKIVRGETTVATDFPIEYDGLIILLASRVSFDEADVTISKYNPTTYISDISAYMIQNLFKFHGRTGLYLFKNVLGQMPPPPINSRFKDFEAFLKYVEEKGLKFITKTRSCFGDTSFEVTIAAERTAFTEESIDALIKVFNGGWNILDFEALNNWEFTEFNQTFAVLFDFDDGIPDLSVIE